ncbi:MAG: esterase family protein [Melioribacteraceae bacterium]|nr:esterase family protein [Melioribacteraceae bacterium]
MKEKTIFLLLILFPVIIFAQTGKVFDELTVESKILKMERKYAIYLPPDYETSERSYPVLYLLHGAGDDHTGWVQFGEVLHITDKAIKNGSATPMIIVMPDADTKKRGYVNSVTEDWRYEDFFFDELVTHVEKKYRIKSAKRYRAIAGLSMGGGGTFFYALHKTDLFSSACPLSASCGPLSLEDTKNQLKWRNPGTEDFTAGQIEKFYDEYSVLNLIEKLPAEKLNSVRWFIDCGDDDFLFEGNSLVHIAMRKKNIAHEYRVRNGAHNWTYWRESLPEVLKFVSDAFHQH